MKAAVVHGPGDLRIEDVLEPVAGPGEVVLAIKAAATCHTDVKSVLRGHPSLGPYPARLGHEFAGVTMGPAMYSCRSVPQMPHEATRTVTCPASGPGGSGTSSMRRSPRPWTNAALMSR